MTTRIRLEPYTTRHIDLLLQAAIESWADLNPFMPWCHTNYQREEASQFVLASMDHFKAGTSYEFAIMSESGDYLGGCGLNQLDPHYQRANLGYWVRSSAMGRGVATHAVRDLALWAWSNTDLIRLEIVVSIMNVKSCRVAEKAGAMFEGVARSRLLLHGQSHDARIYSLVRIPP